MQQKPYCWVKTNVEDRSVTQIKAGPESSVLADCNETELKTTLASDRMHAVYVVNLALWWLACLQLMSWSCGVLDNSITNNFDPIFALFSIYSCRLLAYLVIILEKALCRHML